MTAVRSIKAPLLAMGSRRVMATGVALLLLQLVISFTVMDVVYAQPALPVTSLSSTYYNTTCPSVTRVIDQVVNNAVKKNRNIVGGLLRMHFHDCFVRGCDASILIDSVPPQVAEKDGIGNANSLRGFEVIDDAKTALERVCPGVVSCADILALVARAAVFRIGGPSWKLPLGRRDGNASNAGETVFNLPPPFALYPQLINMFAAKGLTERDMVVLSGAHTIGNTHCLVIESRLYNSTGPGGVDPNLTPSYATQLKAVCPFSNGRSQTIVPMDPTLGNDTFDNKYFQNVRANRGIFISDAALLSNSSGAKIVKSMSFGAQYPFYAEFATSMSKMSSVSVVLAPEGEVRKNCRVFNSAAPTPAPTRAPVPAPAPSVKAPAPAPTSKAPAPAPSVRTPTPAPTFRAPAPNPVASAPTPKSGAPAPVPVARAAAPVPIAKAPAPVPVTKAPAPVPVAKAPAPVPVTKAPAPVPVTKAPAPVPVTKAPAPVPVAKSPAPVPTAPVPVARASAPIPVANAQAPVPVAKAPAPALAARAPAPVLAPKASTPAPATTAPGSSS